MAAVALLLADSTDERSDAAVPCGSRCESDGFVLLPLDGAMTKDGANPGDAVLITEGMLSGDCATIDARETPLKFSGDDDVMCVLPTTPRPPETAANIKPEGTCKAEESNVGSDGSIFLKTGKCSSLNGFSGASLSLSAFVVVIAPCIPGNLFK